MSISRYKLYIILAAWLVLITVVVVVNNRFDEFRQYHFALAKISANGVSQDISAFVVERHRLVKVFADEHVELIRQIAANPKDEALHRSLQSQIRKYFPNHFSFTVANPVGQPYYEDFEGLVMGNCVDDIRSFALEEQFAPYVHPHPDGYHFDIMARYGKDDNEGILFVSFKADLLANFLKSAEIPGHTLMLLYTEKNNLIEIINSGARINLSRDDYHLNEEELSRILVRSHVNNTRWDSVDFYNPGLFKYHKLRLYFELTAVLVILSLIVSVLLSKYGAKIQSFFMRI